MEECQCNNLNDAEEALPNREEFCSNFELIESKKDQWAELFKCKNCGQFWYVEAGAEMDRRDNMAYKIPYKENWISFNFKPSLSKWYVRFHGGISNSACLQSGCTNKALSNMHLCVVHYYPTLDLVNVT